MNDIILNDPSAVGRLGVPPDGNKKYVLNPTVVIPELIISKMTIMSMNIKEKSTPESNKITNILVLGATGGVGQIIVAKLIGQNYQILAIVRNIEKAQKLFGDSENIQIFPGDVRQQKSLEKCLALKVKA